MNPTDLDAAWVALGASSAGAGDIKLAQLMVSNHDGELYAGRDAAGRLHLLVPVSPGTPVRNDHLSKGVFIERAEYVVGGSRRPFVDVVCHDTLLSDVFQRLASEMVTEVAERPADSLTVCHQVLSRWRELLARPRVALGPEGVAGLFGELLVLGDIVAEDPASRIGCWRGPLGGKHDFIASSTGLEVKTTRRREGRFVEIHGAEQLEPNAGSSLFLEYVRVESQPGGSTVTDLILDLKESGVDGPQLDGLVARTGWQPSRDEEPFVVVERRTYAVDDAFPRIVPSTFGAGTVPPGILRLRYEVDLTGDSPVPLDPQQIRTIIKRLAGIS